MTIQIIDSSLTKKTLEQVRTLLVKQGIGPFFNLMAPPPSFNLTETAKRVIKTAARGCPCCEMGLPRHTVNIPQRQVG